MDISFSYTTTRAIKLGSPFHIMTPKACKPLPMTLYAGRDGALRKKEVNPIICEKGFRDHPLTYEQKTSNREKSKIRSRVEHVFGFIEGSMGGMIFRAVGMVRAKACAWL